MNHNEKLQEKTSANEILWRVFPLDSSLRKRKLLLFKLKPSWNQVVQVLETLCLEIFFQRSGVSLCTKKTLFSL